MKYYKRHIKPYIKPPQLQGFNDRPYPVEGYDWVSEDLEEELRNSIVVSDPWAKLVFEDRIVEAPDVIEVRRGRWIWSTLGDDYFKTLICSECCESEGACERYKFCPNCGANMDGDVK